ncbi:MAG TPA: phage tail protein [Actinomycetes bacterium]|nr:phage tail protein [Actinomycetes bacterium]
MPAGRGLVPGLGTRHRLLDVLPALYQEDAFTGRFLSAFDDALAPMLSTLDNLEAYLDPALAPEDFLAWLGGWLGLAVEDGWPRARRRALVAEAVELYRWRGTVRGLALLVELFTGDPPEISESGGVAWSATPGAPLPGQARPSLVVRVRADPGLQARLRSLVAAARPAHVPLEVEVRA